jgi:hypothetical protein
MISILQEITNVHVAQTFRLLKKSGEISKLWRECCFDKTKRLIQSMLEKPFSV